MKKENMTKLKITKQAAMEIAGRAGLDKDATDGDLFQITRDVQDDALSQKVNIENMLDLYNWLREYRDAARKQRKGVRNKR